MKKILLFLFLVCFVNQLFPQQTLSLNQDNIYKLKFNPAASVDTNSKGHISLFIGNINAQVATNLASYNGIYKNENWNLLSVLNNLRTWNDVNVGFNMELFGFGFQTNLGTPYKLKNYMTCSYKIRSDVYAFVPGRFAKVLINGNFTTAPGERIEAPIGINGSVYTELSLGYQHEVHKNITVGGRGKFLMGLANIHTYNSSLYFETLKDTGFVAGGNLSANYALPYNFADQIFTAKHLFNNFGGGFDLGINCYFPLEHRNRNAPIDSDISIDSDALMPKLSSEIGFSVSAVDIGWIKWSKNGAYNMTLGVDKTNEFYNAQTQELIFPRFIFGLNDLLNYDGPYFDDHNPDLDNDFYDFQNSALSKAYVTNTYPKLIAQVYYTLKQEKIEHTFSLTSRTDFVRKNVFSLFSLGYNLNVKNVLDVALGYTLAKKSYNNLGMALTLKPGGVFRFYVATDNIIALANWRNNKFFSAQFGIYFCIPAEKKGGKIY